MQIAYGDALLGFKRALAVVSGLAAFHADGSSLSRRFRLIRSCRGDASLEVSDEHDVAGSRAARDY